MPENAINCQHLDCPEPVIRTKKFIEANNPTSISVIVDNEPAKENVSRLLSSNGYRLEIKEENTLFYIYGTHDESLDPVKKYMESVENKEEPDEKIVVVVSSEFFGNGDNELGSKLMKNFLGTLPELHPDLWKVIFLNGGVKLCINNSVVLEQLLTLRKFGIEILACGTCLEHFGLLEKKAVGETTNMLDIVTSMQLSTKIIRI